MLLPLWCLVWCMKSLLLHIYNVRKFAQAFWNLVFRNYKMENFMMNLVESYLLNDSIIQQIISCVQNWDMILMHIYMEFKKHNSLNGQVLIMTSEWICHVTTKTAMLGVMDGRHLHVRYCEYLPWHFQLERKRSTTVPGYTKIFCEMRKAQNPLG